MSEQCDFHLLITRAPPERQNFRTSLVDFYPPPNAEAGTHLDYDNRAIELAQKDIVTAFVKRRAVAKNSLWRAADFP